MILNMKKKKLKVKKDLKVKNFLKDIEVLSQIATSHKYVKLILPEYPFDKQLLNLSELYRTSRKHYLSIGGTFVPKLCSMMRSLSSHDLLKNEIEFTPSLSEFLWFKNHFKQVIDPEAEVDALNRFNDISLFHEQNHRVVWALLPQAPEDQGGVRRYLNFAESIVVVLDLALGDEIGLKFSPVFERLNLIYRPGSEKNKNKRSKEEYRRYLLAIFCATYCILELIETEDILKVLNYIFPGQSQLNKESVLRSLELNEDFVQNTNPQWQKINWKEFTTKLKNRYETLEDDVLYLPQNPLDLETQFFYVQQVLDFFNL